MTVLNYKCPCCGYIKQTAKTFNPSRQIAELKRERSKSTRKIMREVVSNITTNIPSENELIKEYYFYQSVSKISDAVVKYGIEAYGIDPIIEYSGHNSNIYNGTFESILANQKLLEDVKFDCISIQNTLHGKHWKNNELRKLFRFMRKYSKYILISPPHISNGGVKLLHGFRQIHKFDECGKKYAIHRIYKVTNISSIVFPCQVTILTLYMSTNYPTIINLHLI